MRIHQLPLEAAFATLKSRPTGLSEIEAAARRVEFGPNRIDRLPSTPLLKRFLGQFTHFFALLLWVAALLAVIADREQPGQGMSTLALAIVGVIVINGAFSFWQEHKAEETIAALQRLLPHKVRVEREGAVVVTASANVVPGDVIDLTAGDDVPADCRLIEAFGVRVNNATITGEARPVARDARRDGVDDVLQNRSVLLAGTSLTAGEARALVFATGMHTAFGRIANLTQTTPDAPSPLQLEIVGLSRLIGALAMGLGAAVFVIGWLVGLPVRGSLVFAIGVIVANVPEGLLPTVTLAMAMAARRMAGRQTLVRHLPCVETLGCASVICTDKTGTLTENRMVLRSVYVPDSLFDAGDRQLFGAAFAASHRWFFECARSCHDLKRQNGNSARWIGDPMEVALVQFAESVMGGAAPRERIDEIPFEPDRKRLVTVHRVDGSLALLVKGAPEELVPRARWIERGRSAQPLDDEGRQMFVRAATAMADRGLRVLAFGYRILAPGYVLADADRDIVLTALAGFEDPPRREVPAAVQRCREAGVRVVMVTGDHPRTALAIAREIGLVQATQRTVLTGSDLEHMSDIELQLAFGGDADLVCARVTAEQKLRIVQALQRAREIVAMTGDGVNDAPALRAADIGVAMGVSGTDVAREAADIVLLDDNFASIVAAIEEGRSVFDNIRKFLTYILTSNVPELVPYLAFAFARVPLALTIRQILAVDLGTDLMPALGLGAEAPDPAVMLRPPRRREDRLLTRGLLLRAYGFLGTFEAMAAMAAFFVVLGTGGWQWGNMPGPNDPSYIQATTACLAAVVVMQILNVYMCRSARSSVFSHRPFDNPLITLGVAAEIVLILAIVYTDAGNSLVGTAPIGLSAWLVALPFAVTMLAAEEGRKALARRTK